MKIENPFREPLKIKEASGWEIIGWCIWTVIGIILISYILGLIIL